jgi:hypothetical protein
MRFLEVGQEFLFPSKKSYRYHRNYRMKPFKLAGKEAGLEAVPRTMRHMAIRNLSKLAKLLNMPIRMKSGSGETKEVI